jgi:hypothetical protein
MTIRSAAPSITVTFSLVFLLFSSIAFSATSPIRITLKKSDHLTITSATIQTELSDGSRNTHECNVIETDGWVGIGDWVLETPPLYARRKIVHIHLETSRGQFDYEVELQGESAYKIKLGFK